MIAVRIPIMMAILDSCKLGDLSIFDDVGGEHVDHQNDDEDQRLDVQGLC